ncbi:hypothetical protein IJG14_04815, partial [bacterium]|nr:hypothetical protein [bacterium]
DIVPERIIALITAIINAIYALNNKYIFGRFSLIYLKSFKAYKLKKYPIIGISKMLANNAVPISVFIGKKLTDKGNISHIDIVDTIEIIEKTKWAKLYLYIVG